MVARTAKTARPVQLGLPRTASPDLPGLERVATQLARAFQHALATAGCSAPVVLAASRTLPFAEWKAGLGAATAIACYRDPVIKGGFLLSMPPALIALLVDAFYGGGGDPGAAARPLAVAERRFFDRFTTSLEDGMVAAWAEAAASAPARVSTSYASDALAFGRPDQAVLVLSFGVDRATPMTIELVYPLAALRALPGLLVASGKTEAVEIDPVWQARLEAAVLQTRLPVRTVLARPTLPLSRLLALRPGDVIPVTLPARVPVAVAGRVLAHGTIGEANGRAAIKIDAIEPSRNHNV